MRSITRAASRQIFRLACLAVATAALSASAIASNCDNVPHSDHPKAHLSNGKLDALVFLPDPTNGYYRASRFDWSGVVGCVSLNGHTFFGEWFTDYDPLKNDAITGPVEEFRVDAGPPSRSGPHGEFTIPPGAIGYAEAQPGGLFFKPGVGMLRKVDNSPYQFGGAYPIVDGGKWTTRIKPDSILFRQVLNSPSGYAYLYEKTLTLAPGKPLMVLEHSLKNTGSKTIDTYVYNHDFFMLDGKPTGPGMVVHFPFEPKPEDPLSSEAKIEGKDLLFVQPLGPHTSVSGYLTGYSNNPSDYDFTVEDRNAGIGVQQTSDTPLARLLFWSTRTTICPEGYIHLNIPPGQTVHWKTSYRFFTSEK